MLDFDITILILISILDNLIEIELYPGADEVGPTTSTLRPDRPTPSWPPVGKVLKILHVSQINEFFIAAVVPHGQPQ